jgi:hypothetical protein
MIGHLDLPSGAIELTDVIIRDAMADVLRAHPATIDPQAKYAGKRLEFPGKRPVKCP